MQKINEYLAKEFEQAIEKLGFGQKAPTFEIPKDSRYGDICTSVACQISSEHKKNPQEVAKAIAKELEKAKYCSKINAESNGFINIFYSEDVFKEYYEEILRKGENIGKQPNKKEWRFVEIVSANPTGLLHIGHARNGIFSDTLANLLEYGGYSVYREYLVNDFGNQIKELIDSVWTKYKIKFFDPNAKPSDYETTKYSGVEIDECVEYLLEKYKNQWLADPNIFQSPLYEEVEGVVLDYFLTAIKNDLKKYKITVKSWRHERDFVNNASINEVLKALENHIEFREGAMWFKAGGLIEGQKDEVLIKKDGHHTYYCQDLIYHLKHKIHLLGKKDIIVNVLGADHQGHIIRLRSFLRAINVPETKIEFVTIQLVKLVEGRKAIKMSKRKSNVVHIRDLEEFMTYEEVRWFFVSQPANSPLEINIQKLASKDYNNPVYYVMYAYSRIANIFSKIKGYDKHLKNIDFKTLSDKERSIWNLLVSYEETIVSSINNLSPHKIPNYLFKLSQSLHSYYEETNILNTEDPEELREKLALLHAIKTVIFSGLSIMKIRARNVL